MNLDEVVAELDRGPLPVLGATADAIARLALKEDKVAPREISRVVLRDPVMTLKVLRWAIARRSARQNADLTTVEHTVMMHGVSAFFREFRQQTSIESALQSDRLALAGALRTVSRSQHAAAYARAIAMQRRDAESDEIVIGALLHDLGDLMLWLHRPAAQVELARFVEMEPELDRASCEGLLHGFSHGELLLALSGRWTLPDVLQRLMDDRHAGSPRIASIARAVRLAHLGARSWHGRSVDAEFAALAELLGIAPDTAWRVIRNAAVAQAAVWRDTGVRPAAANFVRTDFDDAGAGLAPAAAAPGGAAALRQTLERMQGAPAWVEAPCLVAWTLHGIAGAIGLRRAAWLGVDPTMRVVRTRHLHVAPGTSAGGWSGFRFPLDGKDLFARLLVKPQALWAGGANRAALEALLNPVAKALLGGSEFLAMSVHVRGEPRGLVLVDRGPASTIPEALYTPFKAACLALATRLADAPLPAGSPFAAQPAA